MTVTDVDTGEAHFSTLSTGSIDITGTLGTLHLTDNGQWTYDLDNTNPTVQALGKGSTATDSITVHSADGTPHQVAITVNGTNDKAVIGGSNTGAVTEESQLQTSGTLTVTDVDTGEAHFSSTDVIGSLGTLHLTDSGAWTYDLDNTNPNVQALGKGATATDTITVHSADGTPHQVAITVNGTNDTAVIGGSNTGAVTEETQLQTSGTLTVTDVDTGEAHFSNTDIIGTLGTLHLTDNGNWTYDLDNTNPTVQALGKGSTATDSITVHSADGTPHQVTITVNGTNDTAVIGGSNTGAVTEETQLHTSGTLTVTDVDTGEAHFSSTDIIGSLGTLHLTDSGAWTYDLDNTNPTVQALGKGTTATDTITVHSADGTPHQVTITVNGTNDKAVIGGSNTGAVTEESQLHTSGTLTVTDVDTGEAHFSNTNIVGTLGTLHLTDNGNWTYDLDNTNPQVQSLAQGATTTDVITVNSADGTPHQVTITVNGTNDAAVIMGTSTGDVHEGHTFTAPDGSMTGSSVDDRSPDHMHGNIGKLWNDEIHTDGHLLIVDADTGESYTQTGVYYGSHGRIILQTNGDWTYYASIGQDTTGRTIDHLGKSETLTDTITVKSADGTTHDIVITIHGDNDRPYCSSEVQLNSGKEDLAQTITATELLANTIDVDSNDLGKLTVANLHADHGSILDNQDGTYTFTPTKDYNGQVHFSYDVTDAHGGTTHTGASTTLTATPDGAIISEVTTDHVTEDGSHSSHNTGVTTELANGRLQVVDPDSGENKFQYSQFGESAVHDPFGGMLRIDSMGNWGYSVNNANLQHLAQGQTETVVYRVHSYDGTAYELHIDVVGTNDAPTVTQVALSSGTEDTHYQMQASQFGFTDVDTGDTLHSIAITDLPPATQGKFVLDGHDITAAQHIPTADINKLQFVPAQDFNGDVQFKYTVNDGHTDSTEATNTLHFDAVGDVAVITGTTTGDVDEGHGSFGNMSPDYAQPGMAKLGQSALTADGKLDIVDPDTGESQFDSKGGAWNNSYHGQYGHLLLNSDGTWHYDVTVGNVDWVGNRKTTVGTTIDKLGESQTLTDTITVYSKDGTSHDIVITIHGDNDRPYISSEVTLATGTEDTAQTLTTADLLTNTVDVDANDAGKLTIENLVSDHGSLLNNKDGTFTFTPEKDYNGVVHFSYDVKDAHGGVTHTGATTTLAAVGDAAIITSGAQQTIIEDASGRQHEIASGKLSIIDPDAGEQQFQYSQFGEQVIHDPFGGHLNISAAGSWGYSVPNSALQHLGAGQTEQVSYLVHSRDGTAHTITIDVVGTNDKPTVNAQVIASTEDQVHTFNASEFGFADVDDGAALDHITIATVPTALEGSLTLNGKLVHNGDIVAASEIGNLNFIPAKDFTGVINFGYSVNDGAANSSLAIMKLDISNVNDAAHFQGDKLGSVTEDLNVHSGNLLAQGTLQSTDVDNPDNRFSAENIHQLADGSAAQGQLMMGSDGRWVYRIDNTAVQHLGSGATLTETFTVHSIDGTEQAIAVTVVGTNDAPTLTVQLSGHSAGQLHGSDIDTGDQMQYDTLQPHGQFGQLHVDPTTGAFSYQQAASVAGMNFDPTTGTYSAKEVFEVRVSDGHGGESHQFVSFDVTATVSAPAITGGVPTITTQIANVPVVSATQPQQIASIPPVNKVNLTLAASSDTGSSSTDHITHDNTPMMSGTTDIPFSQVTIYEGSTPVAHAISDANGDYSTDLTTLTDGLHNLSAKALAPSSVLPVVSGVLSVNIDTDTVTPSVDLAATSDSGISNHDDLTNQHTPVITGLAEANATISITDEHGNIVASGTSDASGQYQLTTSNLAEGAQTLTVEATDTAGNQQSATLALQVDYTAPTISNVYLSTSTTHQTTFAGSVDIDTTQVDIVIKHGNQIIETLHATLDGKGGYSVDATNLPDQTYTAYIQATDKAGNQTPSKFDRFSVDTHADAPSISFESTGNDNQYNAAEVAVGAAGTITAVINIPADADKSDTLFINGQAHVLTGAEILAKQVLLEIAPGAKISASITDANGNASTLAQANAPTADLSAAPLTITLVNDTGVANDLITNDGLLTITGQETGASIEYSIDNGKTWASSFTPQQGSNTVSVRQTDLAGNVSPESALTFTLDNQVAPPVISLTHDTGNAQDHISSDGALTIQNQEVGAIIEYSVDGGNTWSHQFSPISGSNTVLARQTDTAGNISGNSSLTFTLDNSVNAPQVSLKTDSGDSATDQLSNHGELSVTGLEKGAMVEYSTDNGGHWQQSFTPVEGLNNVQVRQTDVAGNVSAATTVSYTLDTHTDIRVNSADIDNNGEMYVQVYLPRDSEVTQIEITSDGGGTPVLVNVNVPHKGGPSSSHPDHQYLQFDHIDLSTLAEGQLNIHVTGTDHAGNTATAQSLNSYGHPLILDRTASASDDSNTALEDSVQPVTGNVLSNDSDAIALTTIGDVQGTYGLFHLNTNGSYTYTLDNNLAAVQQLGAGSTPLVDSVVYSAVDNHGNTTTADLAIAIQGTNDAPKVGAAFINIQEDTPHALSVADFHFSDVDGDALSSITITSLTHGHLELNGQTVNVGDKVSASDIAHLSYTPDANYHSSGARGLGGIEFTASDGHDSSNAGHIFFDITSVNDLPTVIEKQLGSHHVKEDSNVDTAGQLVITDIDGDTTSVALDPSHTASFGNVKYDTHSGLWLYSVDNNNKQVNGLNNGDTLTDKFSLLVDDGHGGQVSKEIVMTIDGHTDTPPIPTLATPATISGSAGHQDLHALLGIPPTLQQGTPNLQTGWGISDSHGHSVNTLHGQFGTLHINPATGELHYDYAPSSGVIKAHSGGNSGGTDETDTFMLTLGGSQNSHVEVHLHLHSQSVHGNSGHHIDQTTLTGMDISPILPTHPAPSPAVQHDEPDFSNNPISELSFSVDLDEHSAGASAYLDALGITPPPKLTEHNDHHAPTDLDIVLAHDNTDITDDHSSHIDLSDAMEHHNQDHSQNKQEDENHHHHNDIDGLPDIDPNT
ncbi:VCBS domain-containing protein [Aliivibrio sp. 1S175]|uniref:VCBS domain-containing protein n=2 Tax=Aliivibrio sp. 1S175 TaxID=1840087 RepID=UPI00210044B5|nr:VCBS domain-containing protein [Aliivibrio sp. 1S175]